MKVITRGGGSHDSTHGEGLVGVEFVSLRRFRVPYKLRRVLFNEQVEAQLALFKGMFRDVQSERWMYVAS